MSENFHSDEEPELVDAAAVLLSEPEADDSDFDPDDALDEE